jgi:hypothetical protein
MADELLIEFDDDGIIINSNEKCLINLNQAQENLKISSTKEIILEASSASVCTLNKDGITLKVSDDVSISLTSSGITLTAGKSKFELQNSSISLSSDTTTVQGLTVLNLESDTSVKIG